MKRLFSTTTATAVKASIIKRFEACHCNYKVDVCVDDWSCSSVRGDIVCFKTVKVDGFGVDEDALKFHVVLRSSVSVTIGCWVLCPCPNRFISRLARQLRLKAVLACSPTCIFMKQALQNAGSKVNRGVVLPRFNAVSTVDTTALSGVGGITIINEKKLGVLGSTYLNLTSRGTF